MLSRLIHFGAQRVYANARNKFMHNLDDVEKMQRKILRQLLIQSSKTPWGLDHKLSGDWSYEKMIEELPISSYDDWEENVLEQKATTQSIISPACSRYQPTSGTTSARKWIPYTQSFLDEMKRGTAPWFVDMYRKYPGARKGKHFWSLSWMPTELRDSKKEQDDLSLFPWWQRYFMKKAMVVPSQVSYAETSNASLLATIAYLCATDDLSVVFIWSPTFFDQMLDQIWVRREQLADILANKSWGEEAELLKGVSVPKSKRAAKLLRDWKKGDQFFKELWPILTLVSCWDSAGSETWANELARRLPHVNFQGKGLFATEGIVTIPHEDKFLLTYRSHFYEFQCLETKKIFPAWDLKTGQRVKPLLSTGSGFWRYALNDELLVEGFVGKCPQLKFCGRISGVDMVGEKMEAGVANELLRMLEVSQQEVELRGLSLLAVKNTGRGIPYYLALLEGQPPGPQFQQYLEGLGESFLQRHFHYQVAREIRQLTPLKILIIPEAVEKYTQMAEIKGVPLGDIKVDSLIEVESL
jgi:hypothetical protein